MQPGLLLKEDVWNLAICKKNMGRYDEALPMLQQALAEFQLHEAHHPVTWRGVWHGCQGPKG